MNLELIRRQDSHLQYHTALFVFNIDGIAVPSVYIKRDNKNIVCVSTMKGCPVGCKFCASGLSYFGALTGEQISSMVGRIYADENLHLSRFPFLVSYMGAGEPLLNVKGVTESMRSIRGIDKHTRFAFSASGVGINNLEQLTLYQDLKMQLSVHSVKESVRSSIIPTPPGMSLSKIMEVVTWAWEDRPIDYNFVFIKGVNDDLDVAYGIVKFCEKWNIRHIKVNEFHTELGLQESLRRPFIVAEIRASGIEVEEYRTDGSDIRAACGQLEIAKL